jgi:hypothetical protein
VIRQSVGWFGARVVLVALGVASNAGCLPTEEPPVVNTWEGELSATDDGPAGVGGHIAAVANAGRTQIGIGVSDAELAGPLGWIVREGRCATSGQRITIATAFPAIPLGSSGSGNAETVLGRMLATDVSYAAEVFDNAGQTGAPIACGNLIRSS